MRNRWILTLVASGLVLGILVPIILTIGPIKTAEDSGYSLQYSKSADWSDPSNLNGATVRGDIYAFVSPEFDIDDVEFYLDGEFEWTESNPPFDFAGGSTEQAYPWDTTEVPDGEHTIRAVLHMNDGSIVETSATFTVANNQEDPAPTATPIQQEEPTAQSDTSEYTMVYSLSETRDAPAPLHGATVSGVIYPFTTPDTGVDSVDFYLDGEHERRETIALYDFAGTDQDADGWPANSWDTSEVADGQHTIQAVLHLDDGSTAEASATFLVANDAGDAEPTATSTEEEEATATPTEEEEPTATPTEQEEATATPTEEEEPTTTPTEEEEVTATPTEEETATPTTSSDDSGYALVYSLSETREDPEPLHGAAVSGVIYPFTTPDTGVDRVDFYLDGEHERRENMAPYDFASTDHSKDGWPAEPWDTGNVANGEHTIRAVLRLDDGSTAETSATFTVENDGNEPPDDPEEPSPDPDPGDSGPSLDANPDTGDLQLIPTYHSVSVYTSYSGSAETVAVEYRAAGGVWREGHPLLVVGGQARGSLVGLRAATTYEVRVGNEVASVTTWSEVYPTGGDTIYVAGHGNDGNDGSQDDPFRTIGAAVAAANPGDTVSVAGGTYPPFEVETSGTANAYIRIQGEPNAVVMSQSDETLVNIAAQYVVVSGLELSGGNNGVRINSPSQWVVLDNLLIHNLSHTGDTDGPITVGDSFSSQNDVAHITVQNNEIHAPPADPAQSSVYVKGTSGNHVIRYNEVYFHHDGGNGHGTDCFGGGPNFDDHGGFHRDTDVYGNYCEGSTDDGISADGGGMNVRIWDNVITGAQAGVSIAPVRLGPTYIFRNVFYLPEVHWIDKCQGVKTGEDSTGQSYLYHNVWYMPNDQDCDGKIHGFSNDGGGDSGDPIMKNSIIQTTNRIYSGSGVVGDYNLLWSEGNSYPIFNCCGGDANSLEEFQSETGQEANSIWGQASFNADYSLANGSLGVDDGVVIPGFNTPGTPWAHRGGAPDIGAAER